MKMKKHAAGVLIGAALSTLSYQSYADVKHIQTMFELAGFDAPKESADMLFALETKIAQLHMKKEQARNSAAQLRAANPIAITNCTPFPAYLDCSPFL